jgi:hypothetical protein
MTAKYLYVAVALGVSVWVAVKKWRKYRRALDAAAVGAFVFTIFTAGAVVWMVLEVQP